MRPGALLAGAFLLTTGCATATTAEFIDLKTGQQYYCYRQAAFGAIPAIVAGNAYADCKTFFEGRGFIRRDARTDAILRHLDPKLRETLATPPAQPVSAPTGGDASPIFCRQRADLHGADRDRWRAEYRRCMAGG